MNTDFYNIMVNILRKKEISIRQLSKECGVNYCTLTNFFDKTKPFQPLRDITMARLHNHLGISYEVMCEYNNYVLNERKKRIE